jgi:hypothetical protein
MQRDQLAAGHARRTTRLGEEHQREQPGDLGSLRHQLAQDATEPDRLGGELVADRRFPGAGEVALVEDRGS